MRYFHFSAHPFTPGDRVTPPLARGEATWATDHFGFRPDRVYLFDEDALAAMDFDPPWAPRLFEVVPDGPVDPDPERVHDPNPVSAHSWIAPAATVVVEIDVPAYLRGERLAACRTPREHEPRPATDPGHRD